VSGRALGVVNGSLITVYRRRPAAAAAAAAAAAEEQSQRRHRNVDRSRARHISSLDGGCPPITATAAVTGVDSRRNVGNCGDWSLSKPVLHTLPRNCGELKTDAAGQIERQWVYHPSRGGVDLEAPPAKKLKSFAISGALSFCVTIIPHNIFFHFGRTTTSCLTDIDSSTGGQ